MKEGKPKDVKSGLRREPDAHWNLILPQIRLYKVVSIDSLKLPRKGHAPPLPSLHTAAPSTQQPSRAQTESWAVGKRDT